MITWISRKAIGLSQAFVPTLPGGGGKGTPTASAYPSQAETTMQRYAQGCGYSTDGLTTTPTGERRGRPFISYHGCGGPHPWTDFKNGEHIVVCLNCNNASVHNNAKGTLTE